LFTTDQKKVFQQISGEEVIFNLPAPPKEEVTAFWRDLWDRPVEYNTAAEWLPQVESSTKKVQVQGDLIITPEKVKKQVIKMKNWKAAGPDQVHAYWIKQLSNLHERLAKQIQLAVERGIPEWMGKGRTVLIMKDKEKGAVVENYRPITCLPTTWKLLTSILSEELYEHLEKNKLMPVEQKGCRKSSRGTKDQLLIDKMVLRNCKRRHVNLFTSWIDYKKAYDSVPHSWMLKCLDLVKANSVIIQFLKKAMELWKTQLTINNDVIGECNIRRGIFQGDSLSPLLFIIAMLPLSVILNNTKKGFKLDVDSTVKVNHLLYMDDLKLFASSLREITELTNTVSNFSKDIGMEFGLQKCAVMEVKKGQIIDSSGMDLTDGKKIPGLEAEGSYKYLGMLEADSIKQEQMKKKTKQEYLKRVRQILKSELNAGNTVHAINVWAVSAFRYSAGILDWTKEQLEEIDRKTRKLLTIYRMHHPKADIDRLYLPREAGGRGLLNVWQCVEEDERSLVDYLTRSEEKLLQQVNEENLVGKEGKVNEFKKEMRKQRVDRWQQKALHGQYIRDIEGKVNKEDTAGWLRSERLKKETEGLIVAAQDQVLSTNVIKAKIYNQRGSPMCRLCGVKEETVDHLVSCYEKIAQTDYKGRHDRVATLIHWSLCKQYGFPRSDNWWSHQAEKVLENDDFKVLWDFSIRTDKVIEAHRPDIVIVDKRSKEALLVDVAIPGDARVASKEIEKINKYQDLAIEVQRLWELRKVKVVPIVIGALGAVPVAFRKHLKSLNINDVSVEQLQRTAILGTANILRRYLKL
jgi:Reverse transcriptase (RNA-dependent DNA polymerase)